MKSRFFPKKDEVILSAMTLLIVIGLSWQGFSSLWNTQNHAVFQKDSRISKKQ
jgi:hypothetical protein